MEPQREKETDNGETAETPIWTTPLAWLIAAFNFIHVGFESAMGGWLKTYTTRIEDGAASPFFHPILLYFVFFVIGRGTAPIFFRFLNENNMLLLSLFTMLLGMGILLSAESILFLCVGASIAGFGTSSIFPTNVSRFTKTFGPTASRRATPFFIAGTIGSMFTTWLIGFTSNYFQNLRAGMLILLGSTIVLIVLQLFLHLKTRKRIIDETA